ncbi:F-box/kelch-repeat protein At3g24760 [Solanum tuberosum]|uniref:F-box/kelch-repeat protein n=1 Tax=Solanum tuberosum TaxID=4113 RepID=M1BS63_SOLTU|nr:PREDICTED: F-box/kelch-repeat protein At3g24760 [Solanum tuberosum]
MEESICIQKLNSQNDQKIKNWDFLSSDLTEKILSYLPIRSIIVASSVCKIWNSIITSSSFTTKISATKKQPWLFLCGQNSIFYNNNQPFAYDPDANEWISLPTSTLLSQDFFIGSNGFFFATTSENFSFKPIFNGIWVQTSPLRFSRCNPLVGVYNEGLNPRFIVVGGVRFVGGLVDVEDRLAVEIYNPNLDYWELCPPLPADFRSGNSSQWLCSALLRDKFYYVFGIYSCFITCFNLDEHLWSEVQTLRPPGILFSFLVTCQDCLVLGGLCNSPNGPNFVLWKVDEKTMEFSELATMPQALMYCLFDSDEDDKFASLKCVGLGNLVYVYNEEHLKNYPACVCEFSNDFGMCSWRKLPNLPPNASKFHRVISFCSNVSLDSILVGARI